MLRNPPPFSGGIQNRNFNYMNVDKYIYSITLILGFLYVDIGYVSFHA